MDKIRIAICGYGNLGRGVEKEILKNEDMELVVLFTRRDSEEIKTKGNIPVVNVEKCEEWKEKVDVCIMCGGSAKDLPKQVPEFAKIFNTVDSFDTHNDIYEYMEKVEQSAKTGNNTSIISVGWDPGLFSINRIYAESILPDGNTYTFWGKGVSQGHSDAIRRIEGVKSGVQYTIPIEDAVNKVRNGENPELTTRQKHLRECFVVLEENSNKDFVERAIKEMPKYFDEYDVIVNFITKEEFKQNHSKMPHGGFVIRSGETGEGNNEIIEYSLKLDSNPEFTSSVLLCYARAAYNMNKSHQIGAKTVFDVPPIMLSKLPKQELIKRLM